MSNDGLGGELSRALRTAAEGYEPSIDGAEAATRAMESGERQAATEDRGAGASGRIIRGAFGGGRSRVPVAAAIGAIAAVGVALALVVPGGGPSPVPGPVAGGLGPSTTTGPVAEEAGPSAAAPSPAPSSAGAAASGAAAGPATAASSAGPPPAATLGPADNGRTIFVTPGQTLAVDLPASSGSRWSAPQSSDQEVLLTQSSSSDPATGSAAGTFRAVSAGNAVVTAGESARCAPGQACPQVVRLWEITVRVRP